VRNRFSLETTYVDATEERSGAPAEAAGANGVDALLAGLWSD
jgi:hypothetical protein